jgi:hypothetical protein
MVRALRRDSTSTSSVDRYLIRVVVIRVIQSYASIDNIVRSTIWRIIQLVD